MLKYNLEKKSKELVRKDLPLEHKPLTRGTVGVREIKKEEDEGAVLRRDGVRKREELIRSNR